MKQQQQQPHRRQLVSVDVSSTSLQIRRGGGSATYEIKVSRPPTTGTAVAIKIQPDGPGTNSVMISPTRVEFSHTNWSRPQTIRVESMVSSRLHCVKVTHQVVRTEDRVYPPQLVIPTVFVLLLRKESVYTYTFGSKSSGCLCDPELRCSRYEPYQSTYTWLHPIHIVCGKDHAAFIDVNSQLYCVGSNLAGQLGQGKKKIASSHIPLLVEELSSHSVTHIACGAAHTLCTTSMGSVYGWGSNSQFQLGFERSCSRVYHPTLMCRGGGIHAISVAAAANHSFVLSCDGLLYSTGNNLGGQLGHGDRQPRQVLTLVKPLGRNRVYSISCGPYHTAALSDQLYTWGDGDHGRLGTGKLDLQPIPTVVDALEHEKIVQVSCGGAHTAVLTLDHQVFTWGSNSYGQLGHGTLTASKFPRRVRLLRDKQIEAIALGEWHSVAKTKSGDVYSWGFGGEGQLGLGTDDSVTLPTIVPGLASKGALTISCGNHFSIVSTAYRERNVKLEVKQRKTSVLETRTELVRLRQCQNKARTVDIILPTASSKSTADAGRESKDTKKSRAKQKKKTTETDEDELRIPTTLSYNYRGSIRWRLRHLASRPSLRRTTAVIEEGDTLYVPIVNTRYRVERPQTARPRNNRFPTRHSRSRTRSLLI